MLTLRAHDLLEVDDILMVQVLEKLDFADGGDGEALLLIVHPDLLQGHKLIGLVVCGKVHLQQWQAPQTPRSLL